MRIVLILPSLASGGLEKVITELAWYFSKQTNVQVNVICLMKGNVFFPLPEEVEVHIPPFSSADLPRLLFLYQLMFWLRKQIKLIVPDVLLSFGGKFNSFVCLSVQGLPVRVFISDRSRPSISYGIFLDFINPRVYKKVTGIIAQTDMAKELMFKRTHHSNIKVIGNPLRMNGMITKEKEKIILNVGRFVSTKQQELLVRYFARINSKDWKICFLGSGPTKARVEQVVQELNMEDKIQFCGVVTNVQDFYKRSSIFAFTSNSEGFPNALGEAMVAGEACISFDCEAGPSDLIQDGENGFLIKEGDHESFIKKLELLMNDDSLRKEFGNKARETIKRFDINHIGNQYLGFFKQKQ